MSLTLFKILAVTSLLFTSISQAGLTVLTDRPQARFQKAAELFKAQTGEDIVFVEAAYPKLLEQIESGDLIMTKDLVLLADLKSKNLLQSFGSVAPSSWNRIQSSMMDKNHHWTALTVRARTLVYNPNVVQPDSIQSYADLAKPEYEGQLCLRTSKSDYNVALTGGLLLTYGAEKSLEILTGWTKNLAVAPFPNDTAMLEAIANGACDLGIANHYYLAQLLAQKPNLPVKIKFLNQNEGGVLTNGSGIGLVRYSNQQNLAKSFVDILLSDEIQLSISAAHYDYPAVQGLIPTTLIQNWGTFKASPLNWEDVGNQANAAKALMTEVGYK